MSHYYNPAVELPPALTITVEDVQFKSVAGADSSLHVRIQNEGPRTARDLSLQSNAMKVKVTPELPQIMSPGAVWTGTLTVKVPSDAPAGVYRWKAKLKGGYEI